MHYIGVSLFLKNVSVYRYLYKQSKSKFFKLIVIDWLKKNTLMIIVVNRYAESILDTKPREPQGNF